MAHRLADGVPVLDETLATVECALHDVADGGDHAIVVGRVVAVAHPRPDAPEEEPLVFYRGRYARLGDDEPSVDSVEVALPSALGALRMIALRESGTVEAGVAVLIGEPRDTEGALLHVHRGCLLGDALGSQICKGRERLHAALREIERSGRPGVIVYHRDHAVGFGACCVGGQEPPPTVSERAAVRETIARLRLRAPVFLER